MKVALAQIDTTVGDIRGNRDLVLRTMERAQQLGADLAVFPELCLTGYPPCDLLGLHGFVDANLRALEEIASRSGRMAAVIGFVDRNLGSAGKEYFNAAAFVHEGRIRARVHKMLLPTYDVFDEERYFERGTRAEVIPFRGRRLGISICEDAWNDEDFWSKRRYRVNPIHELCRSGADLLVNISASPFEMDKPEVRRRMLLGHVRKHGIPLIYVNLVGGNDDLLFDGNSMVLGRSGNLIARSGSFVEELAIADPDGENDLGFGEEDPMENLFRALVMGTRDYARKCGFRSAVLGLSGGIDSAVTACIAAAALGPANVLGVYLPSAYSQQASHDDARQLARNLGIGFEVVPIQPVFDSMRAALRELFAGLPEDIAEENLQARIRGNILMALSNKFGHLVLSTGNKSELGVGYCTLYGDMAGGLAVISDVPKTVVYRLAGFINRERELIPRHSIERAPTAELRPGQTDQDSLPPYEILDGILQLAVEEQLSVDEIAARGYDRRTVTDVVRMVHRSEYKRQQAAPGLRVTVRAFGSGRRMPIAMRLDY
jgi:NAD+ synthase (glutamine-hydrolysing)